MSFGFARFFDMEDKPTCRVCGARAETILVFDDGAEIPYCGEHIPDPEAKIANEQLRSFE